MGAGTVSLVIDLFFLKDGVGGRVGWVELGLRACGSGRGCRSGKGVTQCERFWAVWGWWLGRLVMGGWMDWWLVGGGWGWVSTVSCV